MYLQAVTATALVLALLAPCASPAQSLPPSPPPEQLTILVLEGDRASNNVRTHEAVPPVVEVRDSNGQPVEGAEVTFELPSSGPGGSFANHAASQTVRTNHQGQATVTGYTTNTASGRFTIRVTAKAGAAVGRALITQTNSDERRARAEAPRKAGGKWKWIVLGAAAGAGAAVGVALTRGSDSKTVVLNPGGVVVGPPR